MKSATDVMHDVVFTAVIDAIMALKTASKGLPNALLRDLNAVHANTTFADLPKEVQDAVSTSVRAAFTRLMKEGYAVSSNAVPPRVPPPRREGPPSTEQHRRPPGRRDGPRPGRPGGGGAKGPGRKPPGK